MSLFMRFRGFRLSSAGASEGVQLRCSGGSGEHPKPPACFSLPCTRQYRVAQPVPSTFPSSGCPMVKWLGWIWPNAATTASTASAAPTAARFASCPSTSEVPQGAAANSLQVRGVGPGRVRVAHRGDDGLDRPRQPQRVQLALARQVEDPADGRAWEEQELGW